ncbi:hypothetical protein M1P56_21235 [Streptomyces sp. HU2014]|uniref:hypothetical protein n=1 Tax=Streptomyces sp. HU2014 TaxID=2939414 RepID=UPI00200E9AE4|nr:hypothetical protein [Streptomyces sp. HU2014]UQI46692.1 hypothetical protein M1P56_21235 [Streptomyces sp. HU2014]
MTDHTATRVVRCSRCNEETVTPAVQLIERASGPAYALYLCTECAPKPSRYDDVRGH